MFEAIALAVFLPLLQAPQDGAELDRIYGDSVRLGDGIVRTWVELDGSETPVAIGVSLPDSVIESVPDEPAMLSLDLPAVEGLPFLHVLFDWGPTGHPPEGIYHHPHWDAHFYLITADERRAIEPGETSLRPAAAHMPAGFDPVPGLGLYAFPEMGVHWVHRDAPEVNGMTFDQTIIYGSDGDRTIFIEPMFTSEFLSSRPDFSAPIPQPAAVSRSGYYPTRYVIRYVQREQGFRISLEEFRWREGG